MCANELGMAYTQSTGPTVLGPFVGYSLLCCLAFVSPRLLLCLLCFLHVAHMGKCFLSSTTDFCRVILMLLSAVPTLATTLPP